MGNSIFLSSCDVAINRLFQVGVILNRILYFLRIGISNSLICWGLIRSVIPYLLYALVADGIFGDVGILNLLSNMWSIIYSWFISYPLIYLLGVSVSDSLVCCIFVRSIVSYLLHSFMTDGVFRNSVLCTLAGEVSGLVKFLLWLIYHYLRVYIFNLIMVVIIVLRLSLFMTELIVFLRFTVWAHYGIPISSLINFTIIPSGSTRLILTASNILNLVLFFWVQLFVKCCKLLLQKFYYFFLIPKCV